MKKLYSKMWAKGISIVLLFVFLVSFLLSGFGIGYMLSNNYYTMKDGEIINQELEWELYDQQYEIDNYIYDTVISEDMYGDFYEEKYSSENTNMVFTVMDEQGDVILQNYKADTRFTIKRNFEVTVNEQYDTEVKTFLCEESVEMERYISNLSKSGKLYSHTIEELYDVNSGELVGWKVISDLNLSEYEIYTVTAGVRENLEAKDDFYYKAEFLEDVLSLRSSFVVICIVSFILSAFMLVFLCVGAGHKDGYEGIYLYWANKIPFDLYLAITVFGCIMCVLLLNFGFTYNLLVALIMFAVSGVAAFTLVLMLIMGFAARAKAGAWWRNTLIYKLGRLIVRGIKWIVNAVPAVWMAVIIAVAVAVIELIGIIFWYNTYYGFGKFLAFMFLVVLNGLLVVFVIYNALNVHWIKTAGERIAKGDFEHKIDTKRLYSDFRKHGESLNRIGDGIKEAVDRQMKSERMKTELITNVSHDIKTPLTSIVNYVDLLSKENISPDKAREYVEVLERQAARMKKLVEDLVESSKASSGNVNMNLEKTDVKTLISQAIGEYEEKLGAKNLTPVLNITDDPCFINADGTLLWRMFDNLLRNICKYAMVGTRVYISLEKNGGKVQVSFKNVSEFPLNITGDELTERFVRGDKSRYTEGSGLGLFIAKNLAQLQGGKLDIIIDGDLFKAVASFDSVD